MPGSLDRLQGYLARLDEQADLARLEAILTDARVRDDLLLRDLGCYCQFCDKAYARNLVCESRWHQLYVMCWRPGQASSVHDHRGSACAFRVLTGECTEVRFEREDAGVVRPVSSVVYETGFVCATEDDDIHMIANRSASENLVTLHCYSPALTTWNEYETDDAALGSFLRTAACSPVIATRTRGAAPSTS
ncbi:MAG: hypothetical protein EA379_05765 [Phycisphaerales bacterium]|nr:MAG: hypothetical protein EA379_05765 [Phycisphaerales bacterium]